MPLLLLSKSNPLRWASIWALVQAYNYCIFFVAIFHVGTMILIQGYQDYRPYFFA